MMRWGLAFGLWLMATIALALEPSEMLDDPALEARARALDHALRCVVCQSESLASSNAEWARDARALMREQVTQGRSDEEIKAFFVERYGEFVLMDPPKSGANIVLWAAGPAMLILALLVAGAYLRNRAQPKPEAGLTADEKQRLKDILGE